MRTSPREATRPENISRARVRLSVEDDRSPSLPCPLYITIKRTEADEGFDEEGFCDGSQVLIEKKLGITGHGVVIAICGYSCEWGDKKVDGEGQRVASMWFT